MLSQWLSQGNVSLSAHLLVHCKCSECSMTPRKNLINAGAVSVVPLLALKIQTESESQRGGKTPAMLLFL